MLEFEFGDKLNALQTEITQHGDYLFKYSF